jgi:GAF domain-containing protein
MLTSQCLETALALALAYAVFKHRVLDVGFVLNRTAVYAAMTTLVIAFVGFIDWFASRLINEQHAALAIEALLTIAFGFALNWIHGRLESVLDRVVFRQRYVAETRVNYRIEALAFAESIAAVDEALAGDAAQILNLSSAAVFGRFSQTAPFRRSAATGWSTESITSLDHDSLIVRTLRALERPLFLDDAAVVPPGVPDGELRPILAIPILAQHELIGLVFYGNHHDGASPDPEEVSLLARLTSAAANAYGAVEAREWRERAHALEESIRSLTATPTSG